MKLPTLVLMLLNTSGAFAQSNAQPVPQRYLPFQGDWQVVLMEDDKEVGLTPSTLFTLLE